MIAAERKRRIPHILKGLEKLYPNAGTELHAGTPLELLIATILSAQCTDVRVNIVTKDLFKKYRKIEDYINVDIKELENDIHSTGFYHNKAKNIKACCAAILERHNGNVPKTMEELTALPGVGRKTANCILGNAFGLPGIVVDTHVIRLSNLIGLTKYTDPVKIEFDLMEKIPKTKWTKFSNQIILHGRALCIARRPKCNECILRPWCDYGIKNKSL